VLAERRGIAVEAVFVLKPALYEIKGDLGQPPLGHLVQVFNIDGLIDSHIRVIPLRGGARRMPPQIASFFVGLDNPLGRRNQCTQRKGTRHHALIEGNQCRIHTLGDRNVDGIRCSERQIEPLDVSGSNRDIRRCDRDRLRRSRHPAIEVSEVRPRIRGGDFAHADAPGDS